MSTTIWLLVWSLYLGFLLISVIEKIYSNIALGRRFAFFHFSFNQLLFLVGYKPKFDKEVFIKHVKRRNLTRYEEYYVGNITSFIYPFAFCSCFFGMNRLKYWMYVSGNNYEGIFKRVLLVHFIDERRRNKELDYLAKKINPEKLISIFRNDVKYIFSNEPLYILKQEQIEGVSVENLVKLFTNNNIFTKIAIDIDCVPLEYFFIRFNHFYEREKKIRREKIERVLKTHLPICEDVIPNITNFLI